MLACTGWVLCPDSIFRDRGGYEQTWSFTGPIQTEVETVLKRQRQSWYKTEWGKDPRVFRFQLPLIPVTDQERIRTSLEAAGQVPTVDAIEAQWRLEQGYYEDEE